MTTKSSTRKPTSATEWKKRSKPVPLELPSGCYMSIKKVGLQMLLQIGLMPNSLMGIAQKAVAKGKAEEVSDEELLGLLQDPKKVKEISEFFDKMVCYVAIEPKVFPVPDNPDERDDEVLYTDDLDEEDKMFIFQVVTGGTTDIEQFRAEHSSTMASIRRGENLELPTE